MGHCQPIATKARENWRSRSVVSDLRRHEMSHSSPRNAARKARILDNRRIHRLSAMGCTLTPGWVNDDSTIFPAAAERLRRPTLKSAVGDFAKLTVRRVLITARDRADPLSGSHRAFLTAAYALNASSSRTFQSSGREGLASPVLGLSRSSSRVSLVVIVRTVAAACHLALGGGPGTRAQVRRPRRNSRAPRVTSHPV